MKSVQPQVDKLVAEAAAHARQAVNEYLDRVTANLRRCRGLASLYTSQLATASPEDRVRLDDLLRAVVVFLHASVEDLLRTVARARLPLAKPAILAKIPFADNNQSEKATLDYLAARRGQTADEIIESAVAEFLGRSSFNNAKDIVAIVEKIGLDPQSLRQDLSAIEEMTKRRHQIVHSADRPVGVSSGPEAITLSQVDVWFKAVTDFTANLLTLVGVEAAERRIFGK